MAEENDIQTAKEIQLSPMAMSAELGELLEALSQAQAEMANPVLNQEAVLRFKNEGSQAWTEHPYKYADLDACLSCTKGPFGEHGLAVVQLPFVKITPQEGNYPIADATVTTILGHKSGQWIRCAVTIPAKNASPHSIGSAITYARRYGLSAIVGQAADRDDDAGAAGGSEDSHGKASEKAATGTKATGNKGTGKKTDGQGAQTGAAQGQSGGTSDAPSINETEQKKRGCINGVLVKELVSAVLKAKPKLDPKKDFYVWLDAYLNALLPSLKDAGYKRKHFDRPMLDIPSTRYKEILEAVEKDAKSVKEGADDVRARIDKEAAQERGDDGVAT